MKYSGDSVLKSGLFVLLTLLLLITIFNGCKTMDAVQNIDIGFGTGSMDTSQTGSITRSARAIARGFQDITPEQEYYIGRTVGANVVNKYRPYDKTLANKYINILGQTLAQASDLPETFGGYHFLILDSDEINAFAASGGLIFVTRGILKCCRSEDALAAVLAHEIGHIQYRHGLQAIKKSRITTALTTLAAEGAKAFGGEQLATLTNAFEGSIKDITTTMINNGYSRTFEREADNAAVTILKRVGYNPNGLVDMLKVMQQRLKPGGLDFAKTHPSPNSRIKDIQPLIGKYMPVTQPVMRESRFSRRLGGI
jgi:predicted Zn-dependent protease